MEIKIKEVDYEESEQTYGFLFGEYRKIGKRIFVFDTISVNHNYKPLDIKSLELNTYRKYKDLLKNESFDIDSMKWKQEEK